MHSYETCIADVNECDENAEICGENSMCFNTLGTFLCKCKSGFRSENGTCLGIINDNNINSNNINNSNNNGCNSNDNNNY